MTRRFRPLAAVLLTWLLVEASPACSGEPDAYGRGLDLLQAGRYDDAAACFGEALRADDGNPDCWRARGVAAALAGKLDAALADLDRSWKLKEDGETALWLAAANRMAGRAEPGERWHAWVVAAFRKDRADQVAHRSDGKWTVNEGYLSLVYDQIAKAGGNAKPSATDPAESARRLYPQAATRFAANARAGPTAARTRVADKRTQGDAAGAWQDLQPLLAADPEDPPLLAQEADCLRELGDAPGACELYTRLLTERTNDAGLYLGRAFACARLGDAARARADLQTASAYDPAAAQAKRAALEKEISSIPAEAAAASPASALDELIQAVRAGEPRDKLAERALRVCRIAGCRRLRLAETVQEQRRSFEDALRTSGDDANLLGAFARFLVRESHPRYENVTHREPRHHYRALTRKQYDRELALADQFAQRALARNPATVDALLAEIEIVSRRITGRGYGFEEDYSVRRPEVRDQELRSCLKSMLELAGRAQAAAPEDGMVAIALAEALEVTERARGWPLQPPPAPEAGTDGSAGHTAVPSAAEWIEAGEEAKTCSRLLRGEIGTMQGFADAKPSTAEGAYVRGCRERFLRTDASRKAARPCFQEAVRLDPKNVNAWFLLATSCWAIREYDAGDDALETATNLVETSATPMLRAAWNALANGNLAAADRFLTRARADDPADARIPAFLALTATGAAKTDEALVWWRVALALDEASLRLRGRSCDPEGKLPVPVNAVGLTLEVRLRMAELFLSMDRHQEALDACTANTSFLSRIPTARWGEQAYSALLPETPAAIPAERVAGAPVAVTEGTEPAYPSLVVVEADDVAVLMARSQIGAARALEALCHRAEALEQLAPVPAYQSLPALATTASDPAEAQRRAAARAKLYLLSKQVGELQRLWGGR